MLASVETKRGFHNGLIGKCFSKEKYENFVNNFRIWNSKRNGWFITGS